MKKTVIGILAHVDAGKTTLAEAMLYKTGKLRRPGRVDNGDTMLDSHLLERSRGITIFAGQAVMKLGEYEATLLDTPGHVDFSAETERILQVLDIAVLVISGTDGVQSHTRTLWNLLRIYNIPTVIFVTKTDLARIGKAELMSELCSELSDCCVDFSASAHERDEAAAMCSEAAMESYLESGCVDDACLRSMVGGRQIFPCFFGSGLKLEGIDEFLAGLEKLIPQRSYGCEFGARVFKITHDKGGAKVTHLKVTGGALRVRDTVSYGDKSEKISAIRIYNGARFENVELTEAGGVCAVTGLSEARDGQGLGAEESGAEPILEPVMNYRVVLPEGVDAKTFLLKLRLLEEEDPMLRVTWDSHLQEINVRLMGEVQVEILKSLIADRFDIAVQIDNGRVLYKETIADSVEGVGHYEPLRHYAEVHLLLEPLPRGSGMQFAADCREEVLDKNWQRLVLTHLEEKQHLGVLTGAPLTDVKITLLAGKAHLKHTEGGDFRQATYRAVRQGLMLAKSQLLEPWYAFRLEVPVENIGRAMSDIQRMEGSFDPPESGAETATLTGFAPVSTMRSYPMEVVSYTRGRGHLSLTLDGYRPCHNAQEVIAETGYQPEHDLDNPADSVFCAHGAGFVVPWSEVRSHMHVESGWGKAKPARPEVQAAPQRRAMAYRATLEEDAELLKIFERTYGPIKRDPLAAFRPVQKTERPDFAAEQWEIAPEYLLVDGYNIIFAWDELNALAKESLDAARRKLMDILCNYQGYQKCVLILVFDAYRVPGSPGAIEQYHNIHVVYTKEAETADMFIERVTHEIGKSRRVRVATSDGMEQVIILGHGALRVSARMFHEEVQNVEKQIRALVQGQA